MTQEILTALRNIEDKIMREPVAFNWTEEMCAIWPADYRPTMSGLLAMYKALRDASVYDTSVPKPLKPINQITPKDDYYVPGFGEAKPLAATMNHMWQVWDGGRQPVSDDTLVSVKFRNGSMYTKPDKASNWYWGNDRSPSDIIAYRVVSP